MKSAGAKVCSRAFITGYTMMYKSAKAIAKQWLFYFAGKEIAMNGYQIYIDASEFYELTDEMAKKLTPEQFDKLMRRTFNEVGRKSRTEITRAVRKEYEAPYSWVQSAIRNAKVTGGGGSLGCVIPIIGEKGNIGSTFKAAGGIKGWQTVYKKSAITARILKGKSSKLPPKMTHQGGQPPFINTSFVKIAFTRESENRGPIVRISGIAVPQMAMNRSRPDIDRHVVDYACERAIRHFSRIFD